MLCQFSFQNFKSYKDEATLDLCAEPLSEHKDTLIVDEVDQEKFLPVCALYGPNGGGKSNVLEAISHFIGIVADCYNYLREVHYEYYHKFDKKCKQKL